MSTSPIGLQVQGRRRNTTVSLFRIGLVGASLLAVAGFMSGLNGVNRDVASADVSAAAATPTDEPPALSTVAVPAPTTLDPVVTAPDTANSAPTTPLAQSPSADLCARLPIEDCAAIAVPPPPRPGPTTETVAHCTVAGAHSPQGTTSVVVASNQVPNAERTVRLRVEVEDGLAIDGECFAETVASILNDPRGWGGDGSLGFELSDDEFDLRLVVASPGTTDSLCYPMRTAGRYSCRKAKRIVLNVMRWEAGTAEYASDLSIYRHYLVNHEVGHFLGNGHRSCPGPGEAAPVMMQQTKGLEECLLNGWPTVDER